MKTSTLKSGPPGPRHPLAQKIFTRKSTRTGWIKQHGARGFHVLFKQQAASVKQQAGRVGPQAASF